MYKEGKAVIRYTKSAFLNPDALISRDVSIAFAASYTDKGSKILDATAATGIRGIRYYLETPSKKITFLEMNKSAYPSMEKNIASNKVKSKALFESIQEFANRGGTDKYDLIDLDPFGGVTPYIYDLMKISRSGTYLLITATDTAVLCGADHKACLRLYDARPMHNELCQEVGLRLLAGYIARIAAQFNFGIKVLASFSYLHYMRIIVQLHHGSKQALESIRKIGYVYYCSKCMNRGIDRGTLPHKTKCDLCGSPLDVAGKVWIDGMQNRETLESVKNEMSSGSYDAKSIRFVEALLDELDIPLFYSVPRITKNMGMSSVSVSRLMERLAEKGYKVSRTHILNHAIRTDAGIKDIKNAILGISKGI